MIDTTKQAELRAQFNPDGSDLRKMQLRMLEMLKYIDKICRENNIKYWLSSGTCLGAVRHGGFIPWDDDVDIEMLEDDYKKLKIALMKDNNKQYIVQCAATDSEYLQRFDKLRDLKSEVKQEADTDNWNVYRGCYIDIFALEPSISRRIHKFLGYVWNYTLFPMAKIRNTKIRRSGIKIARGILTTFFNSISLLKPSSDIYRHQLGSGFNYPRYFSDIRDTVYIPFEDTTLPVPINHDGYLSKLYGDYMALPAIDKIRTHFKTFKVFE